MAVVRLGVSSRRAGGAKGSGRCLVSTRAGLVLGSAFLGDTRLLNVAQWGRSPAREPFRRAHRGGVSGLSAVSWFREIRDEELGRLCSRVCALLGREDWGPDALDALRRLFLIVSATKHSRR